LKEKGVIFYIDIDKNIALERLTSRNQELSNQDEVRKNKANDQFITEKFEKYSKLYNDKF
jgi:thymidylate kinase